jgi:hypothetical protein
MKMLLLFLLLTCSLQAESPKAKLFKVGMSQSEMVAAFGVPQSYFDVNTQRHISRNEFLLIQGSCLCRPLYGRKTPNNEYEITIFETVDESSSRLHPTIRVKEVRFTLDRQMTDEQALADIPEAINECGGKCVDLPPLFEGHHHMGRPSSGVEFSFFHGNDGSLRFVTMLAASGN